MGANSRKIVQDPIVVASTSTSGAIAGTGLIASHDRVVFFVTATVDAGNVTLGIDISPNGGTTWHSLTSGEMLGNTSAITAGGNYHISAQVPLGTSCRMTYTIVTGPVSLLVYPCYEKTGAMG